MDILRILPIIMMLEGAPSDQFIHPVSGARGKYQITRRAVSECNRILRRKEFTYADASNRRQAERMVVTLLTYHVGVDGTAEDYLRTWVSGPKGRRRGDGWSYVARARKEGWLPERE